MNRTKTLSIMLAVLLVAPTATLAEGTGEFEQKDEVIYANLNATGEQQQLYVVNNFSVTEPGTIIDFGDYTSVSNLTDLYEITQDGEEITLQAETAEEFYYQGNLEEAPLPWSFDFTYHLDGEEREASELAGATGPVEIELDVTQNTAGEAAFFENYLLQVTMTFDSDRVRNIEAADGTVANAGKDRQVTFTLMPETEGTFTVAADVEEFEMAAVEIAGVPSNIPFDAPDTDDLQGELVPLADATASVSEGVGELRDGISGLNNGVGELESGSASFRDGLNQLDANSSELVSGSAAIRDALEEMSGSLSGSTGDMGLGGLAEVSGSLREIAGGLDEVSEGLSELNSSYAQAYGALSDAINAIPEGAASEADIQALYESGADQQVVDQLVASQRAALAVKETYGATNAAFAAVQPALQESTGALGEMSSGLRTIASELDAAADSNDMQRGIQELSSGLQQLSSEYGSFHSGLRDYTAGVSDLAGGYRELNSGIGDLRGGVQELLSGANTLYDGTEELAEETSDLPNQVQVQIDELVAELDHSDFEPISFVSDQNENIGTVQFVIRTEAIEVEEQEAEEIEEEEATGFWQKLVDLFR
ncbi:YhgE/Pip domain-containing protein [Paenalkalicoccus suaedae]|uniref:YhgE/Pip domain-containing protein n=1 Tax=Paenalkalicoccus suaedae TaxID=2592382 RepID=A0A859FAQ9_9BACI|nr:YhgE/Pip domain-containing protein [Paenalkalicoccus suaedae]QKS70339.1 YhgE/Pip domain-containing protein [Paenalkalicoccus suaedae]